MLSLILIIIHQLIPLKIILSSSRPKIVFGIHDPLGLRYLLQLRVGLSVLIYHKKIHNFIDLLINVIAIMVLKMLIISYFWALFSLLKD